MSLRDFNEGDQPGGDREREEEEEERGEEVGVEEGREQQRQQEGTEGQRPSDRDNDDRALSLRTRVASLHSLNDRAFLDIIRILELHRLRTFRQCDLFFLPCPRVLELATVFPPRNIFDFLAVSRSLWGGVPSDDEPQLSSPVSARHRNSLYSALFWEGPEALAGLPMCDSSVIRPRGVVYFRCLILDILVFVIRRYGATAILEQFRQWVGEQAQGPGVPLEENLRTTLGCISILINVLETDMNRPNNISTDVNPECTLTGTSGRESRFMGTGTWGRESRFMGTGTRGRESRFMGAGASGRVSQSSGMGTGTSGNLQRSSRTITNSEGLLMPGTCNVHTRNLQMSVVIYLNGVVALFAQYFNAWSQLQNILEVWGNRLQRSSRAVRGRGARRRPRTRRHSQHEPCSIS